MKDDSILNKLAGSRTILANQRTFLAYIRTAIMVAVSGITLVKFFADELYLEIFGIMLLPLAVFISAFGFRRYRRMCRRIGRTMNIDSVNENGSDDSTAC